MEISLHKLQSRTNYSRQTLVFLEIAHYGKSSISVLLEFFASIDKIFILGGRIGTRL